MRWYDVTKLHRYLLVNLLQRFTGICCLGSMKANTKINIGNTLLFLLSDISIGFSVMISWETGCFQSQCGTVEWGIVSAGLCKSYFLWRIIVALGQITLLIPAPSFQILSQHHSFWFREYRWDILHCISFLGTSGFVLGMETRNRNKMMLFIFERINSLFCRS